MHGRKPQIPATVTEASCVLLFWASKLRSQIIFTSLHSLTFRVTAGLKLTCFTNLPTSYSAFYPSVYRLQTPGFRPELVCSTVFAFDLFSLFSCSLWV